MEATELDKVDSILAKYDGGEGILIQTLLDIQSEFNWVPPEAIDRIGKRFRVPLSQIYRIASFYKAMSLIPRGKHLVRICLGTACHVRGGRKIMEHAQELLGLQVEGTTKDLKFTLERVNCMGCCALGPVMVVDDDYYGEMTPGKVEDILKSYE